MPEAGDEVTVVTRFDAGGGYVRADDMVFWALGGPAAAAQVGQRYTLTAVDVIEGVPVGRVGELPPAGAAVVAP